MKFDAVDNRRHTYKFHFEYDDGANFSDYIGTTAEIFCVELCNVMQCYTFANYLTYNFKSDITFN